jgi:hypothetical protein
LVVTERHKLGYPQKEVCMVNYFLLTLAVLSLGAALISLPGTVIAPTQKTKQGLFILFASFILNLVLVICLSTPPQPKVADHPHKPFGREAGFKWGLQAHSFLPLQYKPQMAWLRHTQANRQLRFKPIGLFAQPQSYAFRRTGAEIYFDWRYGLKQALSQSFSPRLIVVHSTEGEKEDHAFTIFNRNTPQQYLGGAWTHFSIDPQGQIYQYSPLNRISKGQAGIDDQAVGIELVGTASLWNAQNQQKSQGSIIERWQMGQREQLLAAVDLIATLQALFAIPQERIYAHEDIGKIALKRGWSPNKPDYNGLAGEIRDQVYLALRPDLGPGRKPAEWYGFLEPYDRQDPGRDVMREIYSLLQGKGPKNW